MTAAESASLAVGATTPPLISLRGIVVDYPGVRALDHVDLDIAAGEVVALVGENGAGKSTLVSILAGLQAATSGTVAVDGEIVAYGTPARAAAAGIALVAQELSLVPELSAAENILLGRPPRTPALRLVDRARQKAQAQQSLDRLGVTVALETKAGRLSPAHAQLVEIAKGLARQPRLLILDEPTSSLTTVETEHLLTAVRELRDQGVAVVYISHKLDEVLAIADRIVVLRDGSRVTESPVAEWDEDSLVRAMVGRDLGQFFQRTPHDPGEIVLEVDGLSVPGRFTDVGLQLRAGEVLGVAGLVGAGRTELAEALFGLHPAAQGRIRVDGREVSVRSPRDAITQGIMLVPEDRRQDGFVGDMATLRNISLADLRRLSRAGLVRRARERRRVGEIAEHIALATRTFDRPTRTLSGGNQQKVVLAKWLLRGPRILILDEPTRGIDVGAKSEIYGLVHELTRDGLAVLLISSELPEILGLSDRVMVMRRGTVAATFGRDDATEESIMAAASGTTGRPVCTDPGEPSWS